MSTDNPVAVPINPFVALQPHFGMLLGVDELATLQGYASGKMRLHNAWLHRSGAVWGLRVEMKDAREVRVQPGLAVDGWGRELSLAVARCLDVARWYQLNRVELGLPDAAVGARVTFEGQVVLRHAGCLDSPVPGISEGCSSTGTPLRYSRLRDEVDVRLRPLPTVAPPAPPYRALRVLFGIEPPVSPDDDALMTARTTALALPDAERGAALAALVSDFAADDAMGQSPLPSGWPEDDAVVLAKVTFELQRLEADSTDPSRNVWVLLDASAAPPAAPIIDNHARQTLVATRALQELLAGAVAQTVADAGGARITAVDFDLPTATLKLTATKAVTQKSAEAGLTVTRYDDAGGWAAVPVATVSLGAGGTEISATLTLPGALPANTWLRVVAAGTGPTPILTDAPRVPIGGAAGGPAASDAQGNDFIHFWKVS